MKQESDQASILIVLFLVRSMDSLIPKANHTQKVVRKIVTLSEGQIYKASLDTGERIRKSFSEDQFDAYFKRF